MNRFTNWQRCGRQGCPLLAGFRAGQRASTKCGFPWSVSGKKTWLSVNEADGKDQPYSRRRSTDYHGIRRTGSSENLPPASRDDFGPRRQKKTQGTDPCSKCHLTGLPAIRSARVSLQNARPCQTLKTPSLPTPQTKIKMASQDGGGRPNLARRSIFNLAVTCDCLIKSGVGFPGQLARHLGRREITPLDRDWELGTSTCRMKNIGGGGLRPLGTSPSPYLPWLIRLAAGPRGRRRPTLLRWRTVGVGRTSSPTVGLQPLQAGSRRPGAPPKAGELPPWLCQHLYDHYCLPATAGFLKWAYTIS